MQNKQKYSEKVHTAINIITGIVVMMVNLGISFFVSPYIVETLGEEANGFTQLANNFVMYASLFTIAFNSMAGRFISVNYHRGNMEKVSQYYSSIIVCNILLITLLIPVFVYIVINLPQLINIQNADIIDVKILFTCVFVNFLINLLVSVFNIAMYVKNMLFIQNTISLIKSIASAVFVCTLFVVFPPKIFYTSIVEVVLVVFVVICVAYFHRKVMPELKFRVADFKWQAVRDMLSAGIWNTINQCGNLLMTGMDLLVTNLFISPSAMGVLAAAKTVPTAITSLATTLNANLAPSLTIAWANGDTKALLQKLRSGMKISSIIVSIPYMVFCAFGKEFYTLWMPSLDAELLTLLSFLTCLALVPWSGPQVLNNIFSAANRLKVSTITFFIAGLINIGVVYVLLKNTDLGIIAVAGVSSVITIIRCFTVIAPYIAYLLKVKWYTFYKDAAMSVLCSALNFALARGVHFFIKGESWITLFIAVAISAILTLAVDMMIILSKGEREYLFSRISALKR